MSTPTTSRTDLSWLNRCTAVQVQFGQLSFTKKLPRAKVTTMVTSAEDSAASAIEQTLEDGGPAIEQSLEDGGPVNSNAAPARRSDPNRISASKRLLECPEAEAIRSEFGRLRSFIVTRTLPSPFGKGIYFVPNTRVEEVYAELERAELETIPALGEALIAVLQDVLVREAEALGDNFNLGDYDTPAEIRDRLGVEYALITFGVPEGLPGQMYAREQGKAQAKLAEAVDTMQALLRAEMDKLLKHAVEALTGTREGGKPKIFRDSLTKNIREFLTLFKDRDITNDTELQAVCDQVSQLLDGVDPKDLRDKAPLRESTANAFAEIRTQLDAMLVPRGSRAITFEEDETPTPEPVTAEPVAA